MGKGNSLFESIFKQKMSVGDARSFLTEITAEHPYFSPAHFFLLLTTEKGTAAYHQQAAKTSVLFNNPYWLQFQLQEEELNAIEKKELVAAHQEKPATLADDEVKSIAPQMQPSESGSHNDETSVDNTEATGAAGEAIALPKDATVLQQSETVFNNIEEKDTGPVMDENRLVELEESMQEPVDPIVLQQSETHFDNIDEKDTGPVIDENHLVELEKSIQEPVDPIVLQQSETHFDNIEEKDTGPVIDENHLVELEESVLEPAAEAIAWPVDSDIPVAEKQNNEDEIIKGTEQYTGEKAHLYQQVNKEGIQEETETNGANHENHLSNDAENDNETNEISHSGHFNNQDSPLINEPEPEDEPIEQEIAPLNFKLNIHTAGITEDKITFEPLHTSDYFASLGIKLGSDIKPGDKLGKQLKSFTEWLKTMKKVHGDQLAPLSGQADMSIQKLAEQSNKEDTVATEAMADVLLMQGKKEKAIEVYKKLSLLNPAKSVYFAAKIDQLKEH